MDSRRRIRLTSRCHATIRRKSSRLIFNMLRDAAEPTTKRDIVLPFMQAKGINAVNKPMAKTRRRRVTSLLRGDREPGDADEHGGRGTLVRWGRPEAVTETRCIT